VQRHAARRLFLAETAATASEYAAIFAVIVIALMVCVNIVGRHLGRAVQSADAKLAGTGSASFLGGPAAGGGPGEGAEGKSKEKASDKKASETAPSFVRPIADRDRASSAESVKDRPERDKGNPNGDVDGVRRIFKRGQSRPKGQKD
jgi:Flp pilus assembly pilin Flp